MAMNGVG
ncbi:hypothetical protein AWP97_17900, partial [Escherichia coli]